MKSGYHIKNLAVYYGSKPALAISEAHIEKGEMLAIIGPNGSGKSTFLAAIAGLLPAAEEAVSFDERPLKELTLAERAKELAYLPPADETDPNFTALETVLIAQTAGAHFAFAGREEIENGKKALALLSAAELADRPIGTLSSGEKQRVAIARVLARKCPLLILDEPTNYLDPLYQHLLLGHLKELTAGGEQTVIAAIHDLPLASRYFERFFLFNHGELIAILTRDELLESPLPATCFKLPADMLFAK